MRLKRKLLRNISNSNNLLLASFLVANNSNLSAGNITKTNNSRELHNNKKDNIISQESVYPLYSSNLLLGISIIILIILIILIIINIKLIMDLKKNLDCIKEMQKNEFKMLQNGPTSFFHDNIICPYCIAKNPFFSGDISVFKDDYRRYDTSVEGMRKVREEAQKEVEKEVNNEMKALFNVLGDIGKSNANNCIHISSYNSLKRSEKLFQNQRYNHNSISADADFSRNSYSSDEVIIKSNNNCEGKTNIEQENNIFSQVESQENLSEHSKIKYEQDTEVFSKKKKKDNNLLKIFYENKDSSSRKRSIEPAKYHYKNKSTSSRKKSIEAANYNILENPIRKTSSNSSNNNREEYRSDSQEECLKKEILNLKKKTS